MARITVKRKSDGQIGSIEDWDFVPTQFEKVGSNSSTPNPQLQQRSMLASLLPILGGAGGAILGAPLGPLGIAGGGAGGAAGGEILAQLLSGQKSDIGSVAREGALGAIPLGKILGLGGRLVSKPLTQALPKRLMGSVFKETIKDTKAGIVKGGSLGEEALEKGTKGTTTQIYKSATKQIDDAEDELQEIIIKSKGGVKISDVQKTVKSQIDELEDIADYSGANKIRARIAGLKAKHGAIVPASAANKVKRGLYKEADKAYGTDKAGDMEGIKAIARGFKEGLEKLKDVPTGKITQLNKNLSHYGRERKSMIDKMTRDERNNLVGLTDLPFLGAGMIPGAMIPAIAGY